MSRKVSIYIYQYPEDANRVMSLRRFMELTEEFLWSERFFSSNDLRDILNVYKEKLIEYSALIGETHVYRIVVRDSVTRLLATFRI